MLQLVRWVVRFSAVVALPAVFSVTTFLAFTRLLHFRPDGAIFLAVAGFFLLGALGLIEAWFYVRELRSVVPRPWRSALGFAARLASAFFSTGAAFIAGYAGGISLG